MFKQNYNPRIKRYQKDTQKGKMLRRIHKENAYLPNMELLENISGYLSAGCNPQEKIANKASDNFIITNIA